MLAAILTCGLVTTSCVDDKTVPDNPSPTPEQASAKDPGKWWINENNMDKSVKPGDNITSVTKRWLSLKKPTTCCTTRCLA